MNHAALDALRSSVCEKPHNMNYVKLTCRELQHLCVLAVNNSLCTNGSLVRSTPETCVYLVDYNYFGISASLGLVFGGLVIYKPVGQ